MNRLLVVAENSLIVEAIAIGLRTSGEFKLLAQVDSQRASVTAIVEAEPEVVLIDEMEHRERMLELIREIKSAAEGITVIVLTLSNTPDRLDEIFAAGASSAISKAAQPTALTTLIRETIDGHVRHPHKPIGTTAAAGARSVALDGLVSPRELEVLQLLAAGSTNAEIARKLWVTEQTVKFHLSNIYRKLDVGNRTEASRYAHLNGLLSDGDSPGVP